MTMTIPLKISLEDIEAIRYSVRKSKVVEPPQDLQQPMEILKNLNSRFQVTE